MQKARQEQAKQPARPAPAHGNAGVQQSEAPSMTALSSNSARVGQANIQRKASADATTGKASLARSEGGLPASLKSGIEALSGMSMDHVKVHTNSREPARINAHAYTQGSDIYLGPGQEKHLAHEAWHVVQQAQGRVRPTLQMKSGAQINDDAGLEREADAMGERALATPSSPVGRTVAPSAASRVFQAKTTVIQRTVIADIATGILKAIGKEGIAQVGAKMTTPLIAEINAQMPRLVRNAMAEWMTSHPQGAEVLRLAIAAKTLENFGPEATAAFQSLLAACNERFGGVLSELGKKIAETTSDLLPAQVAEIKTAVEEQFRTLGTNLKSRLPEMLRGELYNLFSAMVRAGISHVTSLGIGKIIGLLAGGRSAMDMAAAHASQAFAAAASVVEAKKVLDVAAQGMDMVTRVGDKMSSMSDGIMQLPGVQQASDTFADMAGNVTPLLPEGIGRRIMESKPGRPGFISRATEKSVESMIGSDNPLADTQEAFHQSAEAAAASGRKAAEEKIAEGASDLTSTTKNLLLAGQIGYHMSSAPKGREARHAGQMGTSMALSAGVPAAIAAVVGTAGFAPVVLGIAGGIYAVNSAPGRVLIEAGGEFSEEMTQTPLVGLPYQKTLQVLTLASSATATGLRALQLAVLGGSDTAVDSAAGHTAGALDALFSGWSLGNLISGATVPRKAESKRTANQPRLTAQQRAQNKRRRWQRLVMLTPQPDQKPYRKLVWQKAYNGEWPPKF